MLENKRRKKDVPQPVAMELEKSISDLEDELLPSDDEGTRIDGIYIPPSQKPALSLDPNGPRLIITKIDNNFFKSYANDQVLGPFHKCFNAIVGPNGSGKSNVIDSLLFVFGYRAAKIRCKKVSVLLHNSENFRNIQSCTVAIHFAQIIDKDGDLYEIVPGSQFVVSRTAHKDNSSYYELNGKKVQFKEVAVLLRKHGIDLDHNRFLILQGEVEQIAMMKCKGDKDGESGMLEYLEDIIGTSRYKKPLEQVFERVEILSERRTEKLNRMKMVENEMEELRGPMEEAVKFLKMENTIVKSKNFLYQKSIKDLRTKVEVEQKNRDEVYEVQKQYADKLKALEEQKREQTTVQNKEATIYENLKKRKDGIKEAFDKANKKDIQLQEDMTNKNKIRKKTKEQIVEEKKKLIKLENVPQENEKSIQEIEGKLKKLACEKERYETEKSSMMKNIQRETQDLQAQKEEMQKELAVLKEAVDKTKSAFTLAETELKVCIGNEENERTKLEQLKQLHETNKATIEERIKQVAELNKKIPAAKKALNEANVELLRVKQEEANTLNAIRTKRGHLEEGRSSMQASRSRGRVLDSLMQAKREGKCPGLFGRLGDLGAIDAKYDVAVSTACGALDNIVVDTVDCAQWCIEFLKKHDIGRAVFIALEKQEHLWRQATSTIQTPENVHRLYDLIKVQDERVKTAFYYALRDTLVANDLDQASRIAYGAKRYRVVTLKGDLIETTGTMSGGGKRLLKGRMGQSVAVSSVDPRELAKLEDEVREMEVRVRDLRQRQTTLETEINELQPALRQMQIDLEKFSQELHSLQQQQPNLARQIKEQAARSSATKADAGQVKRLTAIVEQRKEEYEAAAETAGALQVKVDRLTKEIKDKSTGKIRTVDKHIKDCTKNIEACKSEITRLKVAVKTAERNYNTTKENIARMEQDVADMEESLRSMKQQREDIEADAKKLLTCVEEITEQLEEREAVFAEARKAVDKITKEETKLKSEKIDIDEKLKGHDKKLREYNGAIHSWEARLGQLKLQDIPDETIEELKDFTDEELEARDPKEAEQEMLAAENHLKAAKPNLTAIKDYTKKQELYTERSKELDEITSKRSEMRKVYDDLRNRRKDEFITGYNVIRMKLKEMYQMITLGGDAEFEMVDTYDPFTEGIQFNVRPPRKTWKKISNLSGGEKTLSSLALVFALHYYKPSPLYVMDEIDAALDFKNVSIVGNYIKERTKNAQFIIISLRSNMFELCDNLVGIYKTYNTTKTITINPKLYDAQPAPPRAPEPPQNTQETQQDKAADNSGHRPSNILENTSNSQEAVTSDPANLNDSGESEMVTTDSHMDEDEESIAETPDQSSSE